MSQQQAVWKAVVKLTDGQVVHLKNETAKSYEEALEVFTKYTNFQTYIKYPWVHYKREE